MGSCCAKPTTRIITIGGIEVGISGLDEIVRDTYSTNETNEQRLKEALLTKVREHGNYVSPAREKLYEEGLLEEYRQFCATVKEAQKDQEHKKDSTKRRWFSWKRGE